MHGFDATNEISRCVYRTLAFAVTAVALAWSGGANAGPIEELEPGHWLEIEDSAMQAVMPPATGDDWGGSGSVMAAWSGGAYDTSRDRLIVWGGGHHDYSGNEIYVFDIATLGWSRLTDRSTDTGGDEASGYYPDGTPRSRHTYEYIEYVPPPFDRFCSFGGAALYPSGQITIANVDCFDFESLTWSRVADTPSPSIGAIAATDPTTGHVWMQGAGNSLVLAEYDPESDQWSEHVVEPSGWFSYAHSAEIDPVRHRLVAVGGGETVVWDLEQPEQEPVVLTTTGATAIEEVGNPGVAYDIVSDRIVAYAGGADLYSLDPDGNEWLLHAPAAANTVVPPAAAANGTYGRFRYVPSKNVLITVHAIDQNVFVTKLAPGSGIVPDGGVGGTGAGGSGSGASGNAGGAGTGASAGSAPMGAAPNAETDSGCGCRAAGAARDLRAHAGLAVLVALGFARRRRRAS